jgi:hypothetical protein
VLLPLRVDGSVRATSHHPPAQHCYSTFLTIMFVCTVVSCSRKKVDRSVFFYPQRKET